MEKQVKKELTLEEAKSELERVSHEVVFLEMSDERLFTNGNGNLALYRKLQERKRELYSIIYDRLVN